MRALGVVLAAVAILIAYAIHRTDRQDRVTASEHRCLTGRLVSDPGDAMPASRDGIPSVNSAIRATLNDPRSFDHVVSQVHPLGQRLDRWIPQSDRQIVAVRYRARNSFGGVVTETAIAEIDPRTCAFTRFNP